MLKCYGYGEREQFCHNILKAELVAENPTEETMQN